MEEKVEAKTPDHGVEFEISNVDPLSSGEVDFECPHKKYFLPAPAYNVLKWLAAPALPAIAVFYAAVAPYWGWGFVEPITVTLAAASTLIGALIGLSALTAKDDE